MSGFPWPGEWSCDFCWDSWAGAESEVIDAAGQSWDWCGRCNSGFLKSMGAAPRWRLEMTDRRLLVDAVAMLVASDTNLPAHYTDRVNSILAALYAR